MTAPLNALDVDVAAAAIDRYGTTIEASSVIPSTSTRNRIEALFAFVCRSLTLTTLLSMMTLLL